MTEHLTTQPALRPARSEDFDYCARLYFEAMGNLIKELNLDMDAHFGGFRQQWDVDAGSDHHFGRDGYRMAAELRERRNYSRSD